MKGQVRVIFGNTQSPSATRLRDGQLVSPAVAAKTLKRLLGRSDDSENLVYWVIVIDPRGSPELYFSLDNHWINYRQFDQLMYHWLPVCYVELWGNFQAYIEKRRCQRLTRHLAKYKAAKQQAEFTNWLEEFLYSEELDRYLGTRAPSFSEEEPAAKRANID